MIGRDAVTAILRAAAGSSRSRIVTIGTFDGVHRGHQLLLETAVERGRSRDRASLAVTFEPLPPQVLRPDRFLGRICTAAEKVSHLTATGVDAVATLPFTPEFSRWTPEEFMATLAEETDVEELWVGEAFALGRDRVGDVARLSEIGAALGFTVTAMPRLEIGGELVSSSAIRMAIGHGEVETAHRLIGRPFRVAGEVIHGAKFGRTIGFPTANVVPPPDLIPLPDGIYATVAAIEGGPESYPSLTYVGTRPTVNTGARLVETHLLDFGGDLYGKEVAVDVLHRLRSDATFPTIESMVAQLRIDEANGRRFFAEMGWAISAGVRD